MLKSVRRRNFYPFVTMYRNFKLETITAIVYKSIKGVQFLSLVSTGYYVQRAVELTYVCFNLMFYADKQ